MKKLTRRHDDFYCKNLKKRVKILKSFLPISNGRPSIKDTGVLVDNDCDGISEDCGVKVNVGGMIKTDWSKCTHKGLQLKSKL
jgi:hypothetical protein